MADTDDIITHAAEQDLRKDIRRDAARSRERGDFNSAAEVTKDAEAAEDQLGVTRHHDAR